MHSSVGCQSSMTLMYARFESRKYCHFPDPTDFVYSWIICFCVFFSLLIHSYSFWMWKNGPESKQTLHLKYDEKQKSIDAHIFPINVFEFSMVFTLIGIKCKQNEWIWNIERTIFEVGKHYISKATCISFCTLCHDFKTHLSNERQKTRNKIFVTLETFHWNNVNTIFMVTCYNGNVLFHSLSRKFRIVIVLKCQPMLPESVAAEQWSTCQFETIVSMVFIVLFFFHWANSILSQKTTKTNENLLLLIVWMLKCNWIPERFSSTSGPFYPINDNVGMPLNIFSGKYVCRFSGEKRSNTFLYRMIFWCRVFQDMCIVHCELKLKSWRKKIIGKPFSD